jgi:hypothetical protein
LERSLETRWGRCIIEFHQPAAGHEIEVQQRVVF